MERKTAHDFDQELLGLFDAYVHGAIDRRGFLDKAGKVIRPDLTVFLNGLPIAVMLRAPDGTLLHINPGGERFLQRRPRIGKRRSVLVRQRSRDPVAG